jgi:CheY-like chemotaxis protein
MIASGQLDKPLILSIDDNEAQLLMRKAILEENGFSVLNAATSDEAVKILREAPVCLILSDHMLSGTTGAQLALELKWVKAKVPLVLYSGTPPSTMHNVDLLRIS